MRERVQIPAITVDLETLGDAEPLILAVARRLADGPADPGQLCAAVQAPRIAVFEAVTDLHDRGLLDTPRARDQRRLRESSSRQGHDDRSRDTLPLRPPGELKHRCVSCGSSCVGTDIGPLTAVDIERLAVHQSRREDWLRTVTDTHGGAEHVLCSDDGHCVHLGSDRRCRVHADTGSAHKPGLCRQFPLVFVRTPASLDVSFAMECRSWREASAAGEPTGSRGLELRQLLADGAIVRDLPVPVRLCAGLAVDFDAWERLRGEMIARVLVAGDLGDLAEAVAEPVIEAVAQLLAPYAESEAFATRGGWGLPAPADDAGQRAARLMSTSQRVGELLAGVLGDVGRTWALTGEHARADRARVTSRILRDVLSGRPGPPVSRSDEELETWRELVLASLHGHGPALASNVSVGAAWLNLRLIACHRGAALAARTASRAAVSRQDVVDTMVLLTKMLRGTSTLGAVQRAPDDLVELFLLGSRVFTRGQAPRVRGMMSFPGT